MLGMVFSAMALALLRGMLGVFTVSFPTTNSYAIQTIEKTKKIY